METREEEKEDDLLDPNPDIHALFCHYNDIYFHKKLETCTVHWSSSRMTLCAGICKYVNGSCEIRLSEPLLKFRSSAELKETLLHEMIHAYLWLTGSNKDHEDHGPCFQTMMQTINDSKALDHQRPKGGYHITIYHNFSEEVNNYRKHQWKCMCCGDLIKRAHNRAPSQNDCYQKIGRGNACFNEHCHWHNHQQHCGGKYEKIAEPEGYKNRRSKSCRSGKENATENKLPVAVEAEKDRCKKNKDSLGKMSGDRIKNREANTSGQVQKDTSLEMYFSSKCKGTREKLVNTIKIEDFRKVLKDNSSEEEIVGERAKKRRRECKGNETDEDDFNLTVDGRQLDGPHNSKRVIVQKDKCTVIIGWKGWYAFESEEDEKSMKALDNKRSQRRMFESVVSQVQNTSSRALEVQGPVSGSKEMESGKIEVLGDKTSWRPLLEDGESGSSMPLDPPTVGHSSICDSTMLGHSEIVENLSSSFAVEKELPREPSTSTNAGEHSSVIVPSCQETPPSLSAKQISGIDFGDYTTEGFATNKESNTANLENEGHIMLIMKARSGKASQGEDIGTEIGEGVGGMIKRKGRSKRLRKSESILIERGPSAACPICQQILDGDIEDANFNSKFNEHIDACVSTLGT